MFALAFATTHARANHPDDRMFSAKRQTYAPIDCGYQMAELGRRLSANPRLAATGNGSPGVITFAEDGTYRVISTPTHFRFETASVQSSPARERKSLQRVFNFDPRVPLADGEEITAVAFANTSDGGRVMIGTSLGNYMIISTDAADEGKIISGPFRATTKGTGAVQGIDVVDDIAFVIRHGDRAVARFAHDGEFMGGYSRDVAHPERTADGTVTGFEFADLQDNPQDPVDRPMIYRQVTVTVGMDGVGRVTFAGKDRDGKERDAIRWLTANSDGNHGPAISHVSVSPTEHVRLFATADATGTVRIFNRHLGLDQPLGIDQEDKKRPSLLQKDGIPIRAMKFVPYRSGVPKLFVVSGNGRVTIHKFDMDNKKAKPHLLPVNAPVTRAVWLSNDILLVGTESGQVQKWNLREVESPQLLATYSGHDAPIDSIEIVHGGESFVSTSTDGSIRSAPLSIAGVQTRIVPVRRP